VLVVHHRHTFWVVAKESNTSHTHPRPAAEPGEKAKPVALGGALGASFRVFRVANVGIVNL
jgi:hypothetical protein